MRLSKSLINLSLVAGLLMAFVSFKGIADPATYAKETSNWAAQALGQDYINLFLVFPILVLSSWALLKKASPKALLVWLGALLYLIYSYVLYAFFVHFGPLFLAYVAILGLSFYSFVGALVGLDWPDIGRYLAGVKAKPAAAMLMTVGVMFGLLWLADISRALLRGGLPQDLDKIGLPVNPVQVLDLALLLPGAIIVSVLARRGRALGQVLAVPFLVFFSLMGIAIIAMMIVLARAGFALAVPQMVAMAVIIALSMAITVRYLGQIRL